VSFGSHSVVQSVDSYIQSSFSLTEVSNIALNAVQTFISNVHSLGSIWDPQGFTGSALEQQYMPGYKMLVKSLQELSKGFQYVGESLTLAGNKVQNTELMNQS